ncbi:hypothetical protein [Streptomyces sp. NPDC057199]|uniref:hypothetical protein n=1 Tax=Streptomyces sp. NPDC057199 TaxID=3346047 RepID=UPI00362E9AF3
MPAQQYLREALGIEQASEGEVVVPMLPHRHTTSGAIRAASAWTLVRLRPLLGRLWATSVDQEDAVRIPHQPR